MSFPTATVTVAAMTGFSQWDGVVGKSFLARKVALLMLLYTLELAIFRISFRYAFAVYRQSYEQDSRRTSSPSMQLQLARHRTGL